MKWNARGNLMLGSNVVELLLPQRRPYLMVDFIHSFHPGPVPTIVAGRHITANEDVFAGHFPGLHVWPGSQTIEGLGQAGILLVTLIAVRRAAETEGLDPDAGLEGLLNLEQGYRLQPDYREREGRELHQRLRAMRSSLAVGTSCDVKFLKPVFAGQRLDYRVSITGEHNGGMRFKAEASVEGVPVATGVLMGALVTPPGLGAAGQGS